MESVCVGCGCTDHKACSSNEQPCYWLKVDTVLCLGVCSNCESHIDVLVERQEALKHFVNED